MEAGPWLKLIQNSPDKCSTGERMSSDNVLDLKSRLKPKSAQQESMAEEAPVIDMTERRQEIITEERRVARRTLLSSFIGAFCVVPRIGLLKVTLYDLSENGLSFDLEAVHGQFPNNEEVAMRVYISHDTYFPFVVKVQNVRAVDGEGAFRHGAYFVKGTVSETALHHFVLFIECVSSSLQRDTGDHVATSIGR